MKGRAESSTACSWEGRSLTCKGWREGPLLAQSGRWPKCRRRLSANKQTHAPPCGPALRPGGRRPALFSPPSSFRKLGRGGVLRGAVFLKVLRDSPTFAAIRSECVPPRVPGRAWALSQRARARRMRQFGRDGRALRRFVALSGPYITHHNHTHTA